MAWHGAAYTLQQGAARRCELHELCLDGWHSLLALAQQALHTFLLSPAAMLQKAVELDSSARRAAAGAPLSRIAF